MWLLLLKCSPFGGVANAAANEANDKMTRCFADANKATTRDVCWDARLVLGLRVWLKALLKA